MNASKFKQYDEIIIKRYKNGGNSISISKSIGCSNDTILYRLRINGIKVRSISESMSLYERTSNHLEAIVKAKLEKGSARKERNPNWKGGISDNWSNLKCSREYVQWRKAIFERDNYICQGCGYDKGNIIQAHHILPRSKFPHLTFSINNGITLCKDCHKKIHSKRSNLQSGELLESPMMDNQQPSWVESQKVQRLLEGDTSSLITRISARHESDDIVRSA